MTKKYPIKMNFTKKKDKKKDPITFKNLKTYLSTEINKIYNSLFYNKKSE